VVYRNPFDQVLKDDLQSTPYFFESEIMSPYITLNPNEEHLFTVEWAVADVPPPVVDSRWSGVVGEPLTVVKSGATATLNGTFGVYFPGSLEAIFYDEHGVILQERKLQDVDPRTAVHLSQTVTLPASTFRVSVCVLNSAGDNVGFLGNAVLK